MMNIKTGKIEKFSQYSNFNDLKEFNNHFEQWILLYKKNFTKGELTGIKRLARFCAKVPGVSNAKIATVLKAINEDNKGNVISRSTFKRMIQKAIALGVMTVYETERKNGSQTSNLYSFNRFQQNEPPKAGILNQPETGIPLKQKNKELKERIAESQPFNRSVSKSIPQQFVEIVSSFFPQAKTIEEYWRMTKIAAYRNCYENEKETVLEYAIQAFMEMARKLSIRNAIQNPIAYFYGIMEMKFRLLTDQLRVEEAAMYYELNG
ncbi:hypothetical protein [Bacillus sp. FJAT-27445]|uniref:hypothetical protein n=1 Tax=Bacillus sp. FJAT-27445 TaxID=1679166 RepID=UPI0007434765|nr:hypothetical protein [Bacillus sp. FJAT-27445]